MAKKQKSLPYALPYIHADLLELVLQRLSFIDVRSFSAVCSSWRSIANTHISSSTNYNTSLSQPPCLVLPTFGFSDQSRECCCFFNLAEKKSYGLNNSNKPRQVISRCVGSSQGWLIYLVAETNYRLYLFNPFLDVRVRLSSLGPLTQISKVVLWSNPIHSQNTSTSNYGIVAMYGFNNKLAFAKCGDRNWTDLEGSHCHYSDITCSGGNLYAVSQVGSVEIWDLSSSSAPAKRFHLEASFCIERAEFEKTLFGDDDLYSTKFYVVESPGELLLVIRYIGEYVGPDGEAVHEADMVDGLVYPYMTMLFRVYKLDFEKKEWEKVESLGDRLLFLGGNQSLLLSSKDFPGYEGDSIYFTDDYWDRMDEHYDYGGHHNGTFDLKSGRVREIEGLELQRFQPPPFWVVPSCNPGTGRHP